MSLNDTTWQFLKEIEKVTERLVSKIAIFRDKALYAAGG